MNKPMSVGLLRSTVGKSCLWLGGILAGLFLIAVCLVDVFKIGSVTLPPVQPVNDIVELDQGWEPGWEIGQKQWYHHAPQGGKIIEYDWFVALEQPELSLFGAPVRFSSIDYLQRFGFLPSKPAPKMNPDGLPIGFVKHVNFQEPQENAPPPYDAVGLTCAACHTGQVNYNGVGIRIEGGSAMIELGKFKEALGRAIFYTRMLPWRFDRFARRVLRDDYNDTTKTKLRTKLDAFIAEGRAAKAYADSKHLYDVKGGFGRTDAFGLILNRVFDDVTVENLSVANAHVSLPHIWDSSWFDWVQYNSSIRTPMARNIGEALGVGALVNFPGKGGQPWRSTVDVKNLRWMERQLAGEKPFGGLTSPKWPEEIFGKLDQDLIKTGEQLYNGHCQDCHWKTDDLKQAYATDSGRGGKYNVQMLTQPNVHNKRFIKTSDTTYNIERIGTDPGQAMNFARRFVVTTSGKEIGAAGPNLDFVTNRVREFEYRKLGLLDKKNESLKFEYDAHRLPWEDFLAQRVTQETPKGEQKQRTNEMVFKSLNARTDASIRLAYKARPLNGIWATAPFLHNGSVRNLYQLLSPVAERDKRFYLGSKEFDPVNLGFKNERLRGGFEFDTTLSGNHNTGHEYRDVKPEEGQRVKGVIGPSLTHKERMAIIEYVKSL